MALIMQTPSAQAINQGKKRGSVTYIIDRENKVSKIFIISLSLIGCVEKKLFSNLVGRTVKYGPQNLPITPRILTERYTN